MVHDHRRVQQTPDGISHRWTDLRLYPGPLAGDWHRPEERAVRHQQSLHEARTSLAEGVAAPPREPRCG
jgi:hypothetical protein